MKDVYFAKSSVSVQMLDLDCPAKLQLYFSESEDLRRSEEWRTLGSMHPACSKHLKINIIQ